MSRWLVAALLCFAMPLAQASETPGRPLPKGAGPDVDELERLARQRPNDPVVRYDLGTRLYERDRHEDAAKTLSQARALAGPALQGWAAFNRGNALFRQAEDRSGSDPQQVLSLYREAAGEYQDALRADPADRDAKMNFELTARRIAELERQESERQQSAQQQQQEHEDNTEQQEPSQGQQGQQAPSPQAGESKEPSSQSNAGDSSKAEQPQPSGTSQGAEANSDSQQPDGDTPAPSAEQRLPGEAQPVAQAQPEGQTDALSQQQAIWMLDRLKQEERMALQPDQPAQELPVDKDW